MKYLIILLTLLCPLTAQDITNTNLDGVTNATMNGVLDDNPGASRTSLGLGTAATAASADFATAAQGTLATNAQPRLKGVIVTKADGTRTAYPPSVGTNDTAGDTARGLALEAAFAAAVAGDTIDLSPGNYYVAKTATNISGLLVQYKILDKMTINLNGARLYHTSTEQSWLMFSASLTTANLAHDWSVNGPGILEGMTPAPSGTFTTGDTASGECGIHIAGAGGYSYRYRISKVTARYFKNAGICCNSASYPAFKFTSGSISDCVLDYNILGLAGYAGHEFVKIDNTSASYCKRGFSVDAGNWSFNNCQAGACTGDGLYVHSSGNNAHGIFSGGILMHNYNYALRIAPGVTNGFTFAGTHIGGSDGATPNKVQLDGYGITIRGGQLDSPIYTTAVNSGLNTIQGVYISNVATATITNMFAGSRIKLKISECYTLNGMWTNNDIFTTYATDAAAGSGGVLAGELYQVTGTGAVMVKQ